MRHFLPRSCSAMMMYEDSLERQLSYLSDMYLSERASSHPRRESPEVAREDETLRNERRKEIRTECNRAAGGLERPNRECVGHILKNFISLNRSNPSLTSSFGTRAFNFIKLDSNLQGDERACKRQATHNFANDTSSKFARE